MNFFIKRKKKKSNFTAKLTILWYNLNCKNDTPVHRNGMAAISKSLKNTALSHC